MMYFSYVGQPSTHDELKRKEESLKDMKSQMNSQANQIKGIIAMCTLVNQI